MWDKLDIRIPFDDLHVTEINPRNDQRAGFVNIDDYEFPAACEVAFVDGDKVYSAPRTQRWGTISTCISSLAVGFHPEGTGFYPWPHVSIKASPNKILQGHNVFGSENIRPGAMQMLATLASAFPRIYRHLSIQDAEVRYLDATYSAFITSEYQRERVIRLIENIYPRKTDCSRHEGYFQANKTSEYHRQKVYYKLQELLADLEKAKRSCDTDRVAILSDERLQAFAQGRIRFEGTIGHRALDSYGIPRRLSEFLRFHDWFERVHSQPLCQYLWHKTFDRTFAQIEGHTMKNVDDDTIRQQIEAAYTTYNANGRASKRRANAIFRTYRDIKAEGYDQLARENSSTFFRNVKALTDIGLSRAFLKSLDPNRPNENVVPIVQLIAVDFSQQRPDWYQEPDSGFDDKRRHLRLVA